MNQREIINKLIKYDMIQSLSNLSIYNEVSITEEEIEYLCKISSILSLSDDNEEQTLAYEIITKVFKNFYEIYPNIYSISYTILSRLGNFPNRELLEKFGFNQSDLHQNPILKIETLSREVENSIELMGRKSLLTNFQKNFFDVLTKKKFYSISAPTSAGKSFIFTLSIIQRLLENSNEKIVLIVPTRALIKELSDKVFHSLKQFDLINDVYVRTVPIVEDDIDDKGGIYVLTQERLNTLLNETDILLDTVFIDEAQEIQSNRGVVLQNTLESVLSKFPDINLFFASPLVNNPEYFNSLLSLDYHEHHFKEEVSPVGQNIIFLSSVKGKTQIAKLDLYTNGEYLSLGELNFDTRFRDRDRMITLAKTITNDDELSLVYCNNPSDTETLATKMANNITEELDDEDISSLISFIEEDIHEEYSLIPCLKKGIAYHYGKVPSTIRAEIEKLAGEKKIEIYIYYKYIITGC
jgi:replicative superfamily II helicase